MEWKFWKKEAQGSTTDKDGTLTPQDSRVQRDAEFSPRFWKDKSVGTREAMEENIYRAATNVSNGDDTTFSLFVGGKINADGEWELDETDKEKASAYRQLARDMGYEMGGFKRNEREGTIQAIIRKRNR